MISILERINLTERERIIGKLTLEQILKEVRKSYLHKEPEGQGREGANYQTEEHSGGEGKHA